MAGVLQIGRAHILVAMGSNQKLHNLVRLANGYPLKI